MGSSPTFQKTCVSPTYNSRPPCPGSFTVSPIHGVSICLSALSPSYQYGWSGWLFLLIPWLSEFHAVWFSGTSGSLLLLDWFLFFFWLCEEGKGFYLHLHLGRKSIRDIIHSFTERGEGREKEKHARVREIPLALCQLRTQLEIEPGQHRNQWATPANANFFFLIF